MRDAPASLAERSNKNDFTVYLGSGGSVYLYWKLCTFMANPPTLENCDAKKHLTWMEGRDASQFAVNCRAAVETALSLIDQEKENSRRYVSFFLGSCGTQAVCAVALSNLGNRAEAEALVQKCLTWATVMEKKKFACEVIVGVAGYLSVLLFLLNHLPSDYACLPDLKSWAKRIFKILFQMGIEVEEEEVTASESAADQPRKKESKGKKAKKEAIKRVRSKSKLSPSGSGGESPRAPKEEERSSSSQRQAPERLRYRFMGKEYMGAGHGLAGILFLMLHFPDLCNEEEYKRIIENSLEYLLATFTDNFPDKAPKQMPSGQSGTPVQLPKRAKAAMVRSGQLYQWCHGSPGVIPCLLKGFEVYGNRRFLKQARLAANVVWQRGLLAKGNNLCHGIAGNAYCFLAMYRVTKEELYLYRALRFAEQSFNEQLLQQCKAYKLRSRFVIGYADYPWSLMEGSAGALCFYLDCFQPLSSAFPGFDGDLTTVSGV